MPTRWVIEVRLGERPEAQPLRRSVVEAEDEAQALRIVLAEAEADLAGARSRLGEDGQEEVFATSEASAGRTEHHRGEEARDQTDPAVG
ncbi:hypothetical protein [Phenylobacterium sp.]|uniref:hypothetical protein n=1 Tax=Phenylobacterium sp. TaxID=1871053 RepID=UPI00272FA189|nr:hypothetical protein [Phenylobacterium sp.]MDP1873354.1 hypothetical protein [Phenylobacterium sp.]MDP3488871.1 hypothetical protein [Phenylobacterium sp.]